MASSEEEMCCRPPEIAAKAKIATDNLLPVKSHERYEIVYQRFMDWRVKNNVQLLLESIMLAYFSDLSQEMNPSSLWAVYSMLRATFNIKNNINIASYPKLLAFSKRKSDGSKSKKKSKTLSTDEINQFLKNAPDSQHLLSKVILIFDISGACRKQELRNIKPEQVEDTGKLLIIKIPDSKTKTQCSFIIPEVWYPVCKKYVSLRPSEANERGLPFLLITNTKNDDLLALKRHGGWRSSTVAESYADNSTKNKNENSIRISSTVSGGATSTLSSDLDMTSTSHNTLAESPSNHIFNNSISMVSSYTAPVFNNCTVTINNYYNEM